MVDYQKVFDGLFWASIAAFVGWIGVFIVYLALPKGQDQVAWWIMWSFCFVAFVCSLCMGLVLLLKDKKENDEMVAANAPGNRVVIGCFLATCYVAGSLVAYVLLKDAVDPGWTAQDSGYIALSFAFLVLLMASLCASVIRIVDRDHRDEEEGREGDRQALLRRNKDAAVNHPMFYTMDGSEYPVTIDGLPEI